MHSRRLALMICAFLVVATGAVYWQVRNHDFVNYDDNEYVTENRQVKAGLTREGIAWAFTTTHYGNWHPLTWISHMLDCQLYDLEPGGHHITSLVIHILSTLLLFLVFSRMTGAIWPSAFVSVIFALHPLHVESVAWVAERKDVLSTFFGLLAMWGYVLYVERPGAYKYLAALLAFALSLMSKPMLVTLPFVLLLLDYWPLGRFVHGQSRNGGPSTERHTGSSIQRSVVIRLIWEKIPFFGLAAASSVVTFFAQKSGGSVVPLEVLPLKVRMANALLSYAGYIGKAIWPCDLAVFYPHPAGNLPMWGAAGAGLLMAGICVLIVRFRVRFPYLAVGWFWYLGTLVPVIGIVHVGGQAMADRYTYVPLIGLSIMIAWGMPDVVARWRLRRIALSALVAPVVVALTICSWSQLKHWRNHTTLFEHAVEVTTDNHLAHYNLGVILESQGKFEKAALHYSKALQIKPHNPDFHYNLGVVLTRQGRLQQAISSFLDAVRLKPDYVEAHNNLGAVFHRQGKLREAIRHYSEALRLKPDYVEARYNLRLARRQAAKAVSRSPRGMGD